MRAVKLASAIVVFSVVCTGCQRSEDRYLKRQVQTAEVVGEWVMAASSVADLVAVGYAAPVDPMRHTISLTSDGGCRFKTFPSALSSSGTANPPIDRECRWTLRDVAGRQTLLIDMVGEPSFTVSYYFAEEDGTLVLWQHADDPDSWRYVEYAKRGPS